MVIFRKVHTVIWSDSYFVELDIEKKLFYLYLLTNERTKQCGIYEISKRQIAFDLNLAQPKVNEFLQYFINTLRIQYSDKTNEIAIKNWTKYNHSTSPKVLKCIENELKAVKDRVLIQYLYSIDTESQEEQEEEQEESKKQETEFSNVHYSFCSKILDQTQWKETFMITFKIPNNENYLKAILLKFTEHLILENKTHKNLDDFRQHLNNWCRRLGNEIESIYKPKKTVKKQSSDAMPADWLA